MIAKKYLDMLYTIKPICVAMDLSEHALEQSLVQHNFQLKQDFKYTLVLGRELISEIIKLNAGYNLFHIEIELQDGLIEEWYLVCEETKTIIYSPGA